MASTTIKTTHSLDISTVLELQRLAEKWGVAKSEVIRRAIHLASGAPMPSSERPLSPIEALDKLQKRVRFDKKQAHAWLSQVRSERLARERVLE